MPEVNFYAFTYDNNNPLNNLKSNLLEIQHPKFENSRLGFVESVHER